MAGRRAVDRMRFRGWNDRAVTLLKRMIADVPDDGGLLNLMGVQLLLLGQDSAAAEMFSAALAANPADAQAAVHLGFVLKNAKEEKLRDLNKAVELLRMGVSAEEEATEAKFWYHLGEGLLRLGKKDEADEVHA